MKSAQMLMMRQIESSGLGYGYLYNGWASRNSNFAPTDWKVPTTSDWDTLKDFAGGLFAAGGKLKETGLAHWLTPNTGATNDYGFSAFGGGDRGDSVGVFANFKEYGDYCIFYDEDSVETVITRLYYNGASLDVGFSRGIQYGASMRLVYTGTGTPTTVTDYDGNAYDVVLIGSQYWTVQNWKCTKLNNGTLIPTVTENAAWAAETGIAKCAYDNNEQNV